MGEQLDHMGQLAEALIGAPFVVFFVLALICGALLCGRR